MKTLVALAIYSIGAISVSAITIDTVPVGNLGNATDPATGNLHGGVSYAYNIGKYEVTLAQYVAFLNAVAATDTYGLYSTSMATDQNSAGISRSGASGSYTYNVIGSANHPVTYVGWGDAARFVNWLHNGQPSGAQNSSSTEDGAYTLNGATSSSALYSIARNANARWFIPSENEWYKAAYHQPAAQGGDSDNYWLYPMRTDVRPFSDQPPGETPDNTHVGNFSRDDSAVNGYNDGYAVTGSTNYISTQNYLTDVGAYTSSPSYYGTFDQGGNVSEWTEAQNNGSFRGLRGGSWKLNVDEMLVSSWSNLLPSTEGNSSGFRVASIPEPSTLALVALAAVGFGFNCRGYCAPLGFRFRPTISPQLR